MLDFLYIFIWNWNWNWKENGLPLWVNDFGYAFFLFCHTLHTIKTCAVKILCIFQCLNLLEFIYSKSEFATKIQDSLTYNETDVLERLILLSKNTNTDLLPDVISKMILSLDTQRLTDRLLSMADRLVG